MPLAWCFGFLFLLSVRGVSATELYETWTSARALGMGNAYTAVVNNTDSLFYNPAGLARVSGMIFTFLDLRAAGNALQTYTKFKDLQNSDSFASTVQDLYGSQVYLNAGAKTALALPYFGFAIYDNVDVGFHVRNPAMSTLDSNVIQDFGYAFGGAVPLGPFAQAGISFKRIRRTGFRMPLGPSLVGTLDPTLIKNTVLAEGIGYGLDLGFNFSIPGPTNTVISTTWRNVGMTKFKTGSPSLPEPPRERDEMTLGMAMSIPLPLLTVTPALDLRYLNRTDVQTTKKIHLGVELSLPLVDLRVGFNQGYYTAGAGLNLGMIKVDAVTYGVEMGEYAGQDEDRRYMVQLRLELDFSDGSSATGGSSSSASSRARGIRPKLRR